MVELTILTVNAMNATANPLQTKEVHKSPVLTIMSHVIAIAKD